MSYVVSTTFFLLQEILRCIETYGVLETQLLTVFRSGVNDSVRLRRTLWT